MATRPQIDYQGREPDAALELIRHRVRMFESEHDAHVRTHKARFEAWRRRVIAQARRECPDKGVVNS